MDRPYGGDERKLGHDQPSSGGMDPYFKQQLAAHKAARAVPQPVPQSSKPKPPGSDTPAVLKTEAYAPPTISQNNTAQQLPVDASQGRVKRMMQKRDVASTADQMQEDIIQSPEQALAESAMAYKLGREHGSKGHELPAKHVEAKHGPGSHQHYLKGMAHAKNPPKKTLLSRIGLGETVKRKYLGGSRGTTATGKPAHAIDTNPVLSTRRDMNKTTPSGPKRKK
jgi:hypothetical protein